MLPLIAFLTSIAYLPHVTSAAFAPRWWVLLITAPLALMFSTPIRMTTGHWLGLAFLLVCAESLAWSVSVVDTASALFQLLALAAIFCAASECDDLEPTWLALGAGAVVNVAVALTQRYGHSLVPSSGVAGLFYQQDFFGAYCAVVLVALIFGVIERRQLAWPMICASAAGLGLSHCRGAVLAVSVVLLLSVIHALLIRNLHRIVAAAVALGLLSGAIYAAYHFDPARQWAINIRLIEWDMVIQNLHWFGWGFGTLGSVFTFEHAENEFIELAFDLGVLSLVFWALVLYALRGARNAWSSFAVVVALLVDGTTSFPLHNPATAMVAAIALGSLCGSGRILRRNGLRRTIVSRCYSEGRSSIWTTRNIQPAEQRVPL